MAAQPPEPAPDPEATAPPPPPPPPPPALPLLPRITVLVRVPLSEAEAAGGDVCVWEEEVEWALTALHLPEPDACVRFPSCIVFCGLFLLFVYISIYLPPLIPSFPASQHRFAARIGNELGLSYTEVKK